MTTDTPKQTFLSALADVAKAIAHLHRLELLEQLAQGERSVEAVAERNVAAVDRLIHSYFNDRDALEPVSREDLLERSRSGLVTALDIRPEDEFALGHLPGAVNVPLRELE